MSDVKGEETLLWTFEKDQRELWSRQHYIDCVIYVIPCSDTPMISSLACELGKDCAAMQESPEHRMPASIQVS